MNGSTTTSWKSSWPVKQLPNLNWVNLAKHNPFATTGHGRDMADLATQFQHKPKPISKLKWTENCSRIICASLFALILVSQSIFVKSYKSIFCAKTKRARVSESCRKCNKNSSSIWLQRSSLRDGKRMKRQKSNNKTTTTTTAVQKKLSSTGQSAIGSLCPLPRPAVVVRDNK